MKPFIVLSGRSGSGKTTLVNGLVSEAPFKRPVSFTTRRKRKSEGDTEYLFVSKAEFLRILGKRFSYYDEFNHEFYAMDSSSIRDILSSGLIPIKEISRDNIHKLPQSGYTPFVVSLRGQFSTRQDRTDNASYEDNDCIQISLNPRLSTEQELRKSVLNWVLMIGQFEESFGREALRHLPKEDSSNRDGYNKVAPYFTDEERITTKAFHNISERFWKETINKMQGDVLEIGPGRGWLRGSFSWSCQSYRGVEISKEMASYNPEKDKITVCSIQMLEKKDYSYDAIFGSLIDPCLSPSNLVHIRRLLKDGGSFSGTVPAGEWANVLRKKRKFDAHRTSFLLPEGQVSVTSHCPTYQQVVDILNVAKFRKVEVFPLNAESIPKKEIPEDIMTAIDQYGVNLPIVYGWECIK